MKDLGHQTRTDGCLQTLSSIAKWTSKSNFQRLTTNVTRHFAFFVDKVFKLLLAESAILFMLALVGQKLIAANSNLIAFTLLFAMGLQNS